MDTKFISVYVTLLSGIITISFFGAFAFYLLGYNFLEKFIFVFIMSIVLTHGYAILMFIYYSIKYRWLK